MKPRLLYLGTIVLLMLLVSGLAVAATTAGYEVDWWTMNGGGGTSAGGVYRVSGTMGQPEAGPLLTGGNYTLNGGYWSDGSGQYQLYLPLIVR